MSENELIRAYWSKIKEQKQDLKARRRWTDREFILRERVKVKWVRRSRVDFIMCSVA